MKICVTSAGEDLDAAVDPRFGRCGYFIIVDPETMEFKALVNPGGAASGGAGIQAGQFVSNEGAEAVVTGNVGPNAYETLSALGVKVFTGASGTIRDAVKNFKEGKYKEMSGPSVESHFGLPAGRQE